MKNRVIPPALSVLTFLIISCTALDNSKPPETSPVKKKEIVAPKSRKTTKVSIAKKGSNENSRKAAPALRTSANEISSYANQKRYSTKYCFLIDMSIASGRDRFFVYDLENNSVAYSGLVAHGCCNETFMSHPKFSNSSSSGCSSLGRYKVGAF